VQSQQYGLGVLEPARSRAEQEGKEKRRALGPASLCCIPHRKSLIMKKSFPSNRNLLVSNMFLSGQGKTRNAKKPNEVTTQAH